LAHHGRLDHALLPYASEPWPEFKLFTNFRVTAH
jgi:hypothetical protein